MVWKNDINTIEPENNNYREKKMVFVCVAWGGENGEQGNHMNRD